ncbi:helix-turn-helix transcriptional regulator [Actinomadura alba]|uniref:Helix-turn-helix domain-containing protein n=1 Tax=Actinomadura alba TaxID=406431 RepID=A0ABR7LRW8_9ACTN|nr:helix-turn-helix transcriptional regulator [Actinomadura alba]MBC6467585.1 helix-turn-helix domain-containing protein [Actinomadura alba]
MDSEGSNPLGEFLRARRAQVRPEQTKMAATRGRRRAPGLRRDEVARLAGLSVGHYTRLEQGRERHPTRQTVESLAHALRLDEAAMVELYRLARPVVQRRRPARAEQAGPEVLQLLNDWTVAPAYILGRSHDVLARNRLAAALHNRFIFGDNMLRMIFLDPAGREFFRDWGISARAAVHELRQAARQTPDEQRMRELVGELSITSPEFRRLWAGRDPRGTIPHSGHFFHPDVGELHLRTEIFSMTSPPDQRLIAQPAEPGSRSAEALALLGTLAVQS